MIRYIYISLNGYCKHKEALFVVYKLEILMICNSGLLCTDIIK